MKAKPGNGAAAAPAPRRKPGRAPGSPKVAGSGRRKGQPSAMGKAAREYLAQNSNYLDIICRVASGKSVKMSGPTGKPTWFYPTWEDRRWALEIAVSKLLPTMAASEISGPDQEPLIPQVSDREWARRLAWLLTKPGSGGEGVVAELTGTEGSAGTAHVPSRAAGEGTAVGETPAPSGASTSASASKNGEGKGGAGNSSAGPHIHAPQIESGFQNFSPTKPAPQTEPEVGETARLGEYLISVSPPSREGTPPRYMILDGAGKLQTQSVSGWEGAVSWIRKRVGSELDMSTLEIVRPVRDEFHPVRPDQRRFATGGPDIAVSASPRKADHS